MSSAAFLPIEILLSIRPNGFSYVPLPTFSSYPFSFVTGEVCWLIFDFL